MTHPTPSPSSTVRILLLAVGMLAVYSLLVAGLGVRAELAESNLQSNLIRISRYLFAPKVDRVLVGSSVAGRLLPAYFHEAGLEMSNLGLDGSRPLFGFEVVKMRDPLPQEMIIDTSTLFQPLMENDVVLRDLIHNPIFKFSRWLAFFRPEYRPSSVLYWQIKQRREQGGGTQLPPLPHNPLAVQETKTPSAALPKRGWREEDQIRPVSDAIRQFETEGIRVILLSVPRGSGWGVPREGLEKKLAADLHLTLLEPGVPLARDGSVLAFSDGFHLDTASAKKVAGRIVAELKELPRPSAPTGSASENGRGQ